MKTEKEILDDHKYYLDNGTLGFDSDKDIHDAMRKFADQFKPKWILLTDEVIKSLPEMRFLMVWCPDRDMWFHMYRKLGEWVCKELGDHELKYLRFTHYMECIKGPDHV